MTVDAEEGNFNKKNHPEVPEFPDTCVVTFSLHLVFCKDWFANSSLSRKFSEVQPGYWVGSFKFGARLARPWCLCLTAIQLTPKPKTQPLKKKIDCQSKRSGRVWLWLLCYEHLWTIYFSMQPSHNFKHQCLPQPHNCCIQLI